MEKVKTILSLTVLKSYQLSGIKLPLIIFIFGSLLFSCSKSTNQNNWIEQIESARAFLNEHNNEAAYRAIENVDSTFLRAAGWDILGVLYYEGAGDLMSKDIIQSCEILADGYRDYDNFDKYPSLAQRLHVYSGNMFLINSLQNKYISLDAASHPHFLKNDCKDLYFDFYCALNNYKKAKELGADFQLLDGLIDVLMRYTEAFDYYLNNGKQVDSEYRISNEGTKWEQDGITSIHHSPVSEMSIRDRKGIFMDRNVYHSRYVPYNSSFLIHDVNSTDKLSMEVKCSDNDFTIFLGKIKYTYNPQWMSYSETRDDGIIYNSKDILKL